VRSGRGGGGQTTDQKAGGSSPSERAQVTGPCPVRGGVFLGPVGAMLGAKAAGSVPNSAWLMDAAKARRSPIDVARAYGQRHDAAAAVATLMGAERVAPEEVHYHVVVRELLRELLKRERRSATPGLRPLAQRVGVL
jgi:hypothetical protein